MIILASASPRRSELLSLITKDFEVRVSDVDETTDIASPDERVKNLAQKKARAVAVLCPNDIIIGADTVVFAKGEILEKPVDIKDAERMMRMLKDSRHEVFTGLCIIKDSREIIDCCKTTVEFANITDAEIKSYLETEQISDKAGAYAIQEGAAKFVRGISGDFFNVMGLPVCLVYERLCSLSD